MSPIRTRAQIRRKSEVPLSGSPSPSTPEHTGNSSQSCIAPVPATRSSNVKKIVRSRRRKSFKIEVLADRTSTLNIVEQRKRRRKTSFHPEPVALTKITPLNDIKKASPVQATEKRRRRMARRDRLPSLHVHWAENLLRVATSSPSPSTSVLRRDQGTQAGGQPRSILRVFRDDRPAKPHPSDIMPAGILGNKSNALRGTPLYALPEVPRNITLRRPRRDFCASPHTRASGSQMLSFDDSPPDPGNANSDESFAGDTGQAPSAPLRIPAKSVPAERNSSAPIPPSRPKATCTTSATSSATYECGAVSGPSTASSSSVSIPPTQARARRLTAFADDHTLAPGPLPTEIPIAPQHRWLNLPENRIDRWIIVFYMIYAPIILPLLLRVLGMI